MPNYETVWSYLGVQLLLDVLDIIIAVSRFMQSNLYSELIIMTPKSVKFVLNTYS